VDGPALANLNFKHPEETHSDLHKRLSPPYFSQGGGRSPAFVSLPGNYPDGGLLPFATARSSGWMDLGPHSHY